MGEIGTPRPSEGGGPVAKKEEEGCAAAAVAAAAVDAAIASFPARVFSVDSVLRARLKS